MIISDCVCIAQARVIAGNVKEPHVCCIGYSPRQDDFLRFCIPFSDPGLRSVRRWSIFSFDGSKEGLEPRENRRETYHFGGVRSTGGKLTEAEKKKLHALILSRFRYERELHEVRDSIGVFVPTPGSISLERIELDHEKDGKELHYIDCMKRRGLWYPDFKLRIIGKHSKDGRSLKFDKSLLAWDFYEAFRRGDVNPADALNSYKEPYFITGNHLSYRTAFMVIGVLSAPTGYIEKHAIHQQTGLLL